MQQTTECLGTESGWLLKACLLFPMLRYKKEFKRLADTHWPANLLLVTHEYGVLAGLELGGTTEPMEATYCSCVELVRTDSKTHNWTTGQCHGVYKYDTIID